MPCLVVRFCVSAKNASPAHPNGLNMLRVQAALGCVLGCVSRMDRTELREHLARRLIKELEFHSASWT
jgi:hypothetical protein